MSLLGLLGQGFGSGSGGSSVSTPTLTVADNEDGTGATATVSDSDAGTTSTIYAYKMDGVEGLVTASGTGSRVGDGTAAISLSRGSYVAYAISSDGTSSAASNVVLFYVTDNETAVHKQALDAVVTAIRNLGLESIHTKEIQARKIPYDDDRIFPGITVSWTSEREAGGTTQRDDTGYPLLVTMIQGSGKDSTEGLAKIALWRQQIMRAFNRKRLAGISATGVHQLECTVQRQKVTLPDKFKDNYDAGQLVVTCWFREPRG